MPDSKHFRSAYACVFVINPHIGFIEMMQHTSSNTKHLLTSREWLRPIKSARDVGQVTSDTACTY